MSFLNESVGLIGGMSHTGPVGGGPAIILKTTDGGRDWRTVFTHDGGRGFAWKIFPVTPKLIYVALQSQDGIYRVAKSTDAGDNRDVQIVATGRLPGPAVQGIGFLDDRSGWWVGSSRAWTGPRRRSTWTPVPMSDRTINRFEKSAARCSRPAPRHSAVQCRARAASFSVTDRRAAATSGTPQ